MAILNNLTMLRRVPSAAHDSGVIDVYCQMLYNTLVEHGAYLGCVYPAEQPRVICRMAIARYLIPDAGPSGSRERSQSLDCRSCFL
jgi:hypothetical protein